MLNDTQQTDEITPTAYSDDSPKRKVLATPDVSQDLGIDAKILKIRHSFSWMPGYTPKGSPARSSSAWHKDWTIASCSVQSRIDECTHLKLESLRDETIFNKNGQVKLNVHWTRHRRRHWTDKQQSFFAFICKKYIFIVTSWHNRQTDRQNNVLYVTGKFDGFLPWAKKRRIMWEFCHGARVNWFADPESSFNAFCKNNNKIAII